MISKRITYLLISFLLLPLLVQAQDTQNNSSDELIETLVAHLSFDERMNESPQALSQEFSQNPLGLPQEQNQQMLDLFMEAFTADTLNENARRHFKEYFDEDKAKNALKELEKGTLETAFDAEREHFTIQGRRKSVVNRYELEQDPPSEERIKLIDDLAEHMSAADAEVESQVILIRAIITAFDLLNDQQSLSEDQIEGFVSNYRGQLESQINEDIRNRFLVRYYELDDKALEAYGSFYHSEAGNWLIQTTHKAMQEAYGTASDRFLKSIREL